MRTLLRDVGGLARQTLTAALGCLLVCAGLTWWESRGRGR